MQITFGEAWYFNCDEEKQLIFIENGKIRVSYSFQAKILDGDLLPNIARPSYVAYERSSFAFMTIERTEERSSLVITVATACKCSKK